MKNYIKLSEIVSVVIFLTMIFVFHGLVTADKSTQDQHQAEVDTLALRISEARKSVRESGEHANDMNQLIALGKALYLGGAQRPEEPWLKESFDVWDELLVRQPNEPLVQAYAGSVRVLQARDAFFPWTKGKLLKQGQSLLAAAHSQSPGNMQVIWLQAITAYHLPERFNQRDSATKNFAILAETLEASEMVKTDTADQNAEDGKKTIVMIDNLEPAMKASVWYYRGLELEKRSETAAAITAWRRSVKAEPDSTAAKSAAACLLKHSAE